MTSAPIHGDYAAPGSRAFWLGFGTGATTLLIIPPLFEELNRLRRTLVQLMRVLHDDAGIAARLPDLPGTNESVAPLAQQTLTGWRAAAAAAAEQVGATHILAIRGGALIDDAVPLPGLRFMAPTGAMLVRRLARVPAAGGYDLSPALRAELAAAVPAMRADRTPLPQPAGAPWLAAEPVDDPALVHTLASAVRSWLNPVAY